MATAKSLIKAVTEGDLETVRSLLKDNRSLAQVHSDDGWTPLHLAAHYGHREIAQELLKAGALVSARSTNEMQNTPIHAAAAGNQQELVALLLDHGADIHAAQRNGWVALHSAAQNGNLELVKDMVKRGARYDVPNDQGKTPLSVAAEAGHQHIVDWFRQRFERAG